MNTEIRAACEADGDYLYGCLVSLCAYMAQIDSEYSRNFPTSGNAELYHFFTSIIHGEGFIGAVASVDGQPCGSIYGNVKASELPVAYDGQVFHIAVTWVEPGYSCQGIGTAMMAWLELVLRDMNIPRIELSYLSSNASAESFWKKVGFRPFRVFAYYEIGE